VNYKHAYHTVVVHYTALSAHIANTHSLIYLLCVLTPLVTLNTNSANMLSLSLGSPFFFLCHTDILIYV